MDQKFKRKYLPIIVLAGSIIISFGMASLRPAPPKEERIEKATLVETKEIKKEEVQLTVKGTGLVRSVSEVSLVPEVAGKIIYKTGQFVNGATFKKGDLLYRIDPKDYQLQLKVANAEVANAEVRYKMELEESQIAKDEWKLYQKNNPNEKANSLTLRGPQLELAKASLDAARARLEIAKLNLSRTYIRAPFNGSVRNKYIDENQYVGPGTKLAEIFSIEKAQIDISVDPKELDWLDPGVKSSAKVALNLNTRSIEWNGYLLSVGSGLDRKSRLVNLTVEVNNPLESESPLLNGYYVNVEVKGNIVKDVYRVPRYALHDNNIWLFDNGQLKIQPVKFLKIENEDAVISAEIPSGTKLILSNLPVAKNGIKLRTE